MMMLIHNICMAFRGLGSLRNVDIVIKEIAAMLLYMENRKCIYFLAKFKMTVVLLYLFLDFANKLC